MLKGYRAYLAAFIILAVSAAFVVVGCAKKEEEEAFVNIGAVLPITGNIAQYGKFWQQGLELALDDAVNQGIIGKDKIKLIVEDGQADPRKSVDAFNKLTEIDKVVACVPATSGVTLALKPISNQKRVVLINATAISTEIEDAGDFVFSVIPSAKYTGSFLAETAYNKLGKRKAGILYRNDASGSSFRDEFSKRFAELGGQIVFEDTHEPNEVDYRANIAKIKAVKDMDILFVASWGPEVAYYVKQAAEMAVSKQILAYETFYTPKVLEIAGSAANGVIFSAPQFNADPDAPAIKEFRDKILKKYNQDEVNYHIAGHYDAMMLLIKAVANGNTTGDAIRSYLHGLKEYDGITGKITFDDKGGGSIPLAVYTVRNNEFVVY